MWPDGRTYNGEYKNDMRCGSGIHKWPDGKIYDGEWEKNKQHGNAILT